MGRRCLYKGDEWRCEWGENFCPIPRGRDFKNLISFFPALFLPQSCRSCLHRVHFFNLLSLNKKLFSHQIKSETVSNPSINCRLIKYFSKEKKPVENSTQMYMNGKTDQHTSFCMSTRCVLKGRETRSRGKKSEYNHIQEFSSSPSVTAKSWSLSGHWGNRENGVLFLNKTRTSAKN